MMWEPVEEWVPGDNIGENKKEKWATLRWRGKKKKQIGRIRQDLGERTIRDKILLKIRVWQRKNHISNPDLPTVSPGSFVNTNKLTCSTEIVETSTKYFIYFSQLN